MWQPSCMEKLEHDRKWYPCVLVYDHYPQTHGDASCTYCTGFWVNRSTGAKLGQVFFCTYSALFKHHDRTLKHFIIPPTHPFTHQWWLLPWQAMPTPFRVECQEITSSLAIGQATLSTEPQSPHRVTKEELNTVNWHWRSMSVYFEWTLRLNTKPRDHKQFDIYKLGFAIVNKLFLVFVCFFSLMKTF